MSTQFQVTLSKVLKNKTEKIKQQLEASAKEHAENIVQLLRRRATSFGEYSVNQGIGVVANIRSQHSASKWRMYRNRASSKDSISFVFRNDAVSRHNKYPYVKSIYGDPFRSKKLSENRWNGFKRFVLDAFKDKIKYDIYKGDVF